MRRLRHFVFLPFALLAIEGCKRSPNDANSPPILVAAAVSLKAPLEELADRYEAQHRVKSAQAAASSRHVVFSFGASGDLARQIESGAPAALFASAAKEPADALVDAGALTPSCVLATGRLVLVRRDVPALSALTWQTLATDPGLTHLALGLTPSVPAGVYAERALNGLGVFGALGQKIVRGANVRSVLDMVTLGEADAAIVYATDASDALGRGEKLVVVGPPPDAVAPRVVYSLGVVRGAPAEAADLAKFFCAPEAADAFAAHGFGSR